MNKPSKDHHILGHFLKPKPKNGPMAKLISAVRKPHIAGILAACSTATVAMGAYPESRLKDQHGLANEIADRIEFTAQELLPILGGDNSQKTPMEVLWLLVGATGFWTANVAALSNLMRKKIAEAEEDDQWKPQDMVESKFLLAADRLPDENDLKLLLARDGFTKLDMTQAYCTRKGGVELKLQHCKNEDGTTITILKGKRKVPSMNGSERSEVYETVIADSHYSQLFWDTIMNNAIDKGVFSMVTNKTRYTKHYEKERVTIHIDSYGQDESGTKRLMIEIVQLESDERNAMEALPEEFRGVILGRTKRDPDQRVQDRSYQELLESAITYETERIELLLQSHGISTKQWSPNHNTKTPRDLARELVMGESTLEVDENGELYRRSQILNLHVYINIDGRKRKLVEDKQTLGERIISQRGHDFLAEKMLPGEDTVAASIRTIREELGLEAKTIISPIPGTKEVIKRSYNYPGLRGLYQIREAKILILPEQYRPEGYIENRDNGRKIHFVWKDVLPQE